MGKIKWNLEGCENVCIEDKENGYAIVVNKEDGLLFCPHGYYYEIDLADVHHVLMCEPKLLRKGMVCIFAAKTEKIFRIDGSPAVVRLNKKQKDEFYALYKLLKENRVNLSIC